IRIGEPVPTRGRRADRAAVSAVTAEVQSVVERLLVGVREDPAPGAFGRWLSEIFNERPWLLEQAGDDVPAKQGSG
ncbi:MAG TPA: hypothetical protein VK992_04410, partial [Candidatus Caenarcaniphilales bacterium]|nr:hypothetical protein [Candidatus Caenarcaniphilales bacterium]